MFNKSNLDRKSSNNNYTISKVENVFFLNGISASLDWNSLLSSLDYFSTIYQNYNVYLYFPIPQFVAYVISSCFFPFFYQRYGYQKLIKAGMIGTNLFLFLLLLISIVFKQSQTTGFYLSLVSTFLLGFSNNLCQLSFYGLINFFGSKTVSRFTIGTSVSGIFLIICRALITLAFNNDKPSVFQILIYYLIGNAFNLYSLYSNLGLFQSPIYLDRQKIQLIKIQHQQIDEKQISYGQQQQLSYFNKLRNAFKFTSPYCLCITVDVFITFTLFPNLISQKPTGLGPLWTGIMFILIFNVGDFLGRIVGDFRGSFNSRSIIYLLFVRFFFYYIISVMVKQFAQEDILLNNNLFPFVNQFLFAFTNGLVLNGSFILAYEQVPANYRNYSGILCGIMWQLGLMFGTFAAIPLHYIVNPDL